MSQNSSLEEQFSKLKGLILNDDEAAVRAMLEESNCSALLSHVDDDEYTILGLSVERGFFKITAALLDAKADVNLPFLGGLSPLSAAATMGFDETIRVLLKQPRIDVDFVDQAGDTPLLRATYQGDTAIVEQLLVANAAVNAVAESGDTALLAAADNGDVETIRVLAKHKADLDHLTVSGHSALLNAVNEGHDDAVAALLDAKAAVDCTRAGSFTPLMAAAFKGRVSTAKLLLAGGANVACCAAGQIVALHTAALHGRAAIVAELLAAGADPNAASDDGCTPVMMAADMGHADCIELLFKKKADLNLSSRDKTALVRAVGNDHFDAAKFLLEHGADWLIKGSQSARQLSHRLGDQTCTLFQCLLCGWEGMCCHACRKKYCVLECDKVTDPKNSALSTTVDCKLHEKLAHQALLEWALAMSSLQLPPYVVEHIFDSLKLNSRETNYQHRRATAFLWIPEHASTKINQNFVHLIAEERKHQDNIKLFISIHDTLKKHQE